MATVCSIKDSRRYESRVYDKIAKKYSTIYNLETNSKPGEIQFKEDRISLDDFMISEYPELMDLYLNNDFSKQDAHVAVMKLVARIPKILNNAKDKKMDILDDNNDKIKSIRFSTAMSEIGIRTIDVSNHLDMLEAQETEEDYIYYVEGLVVPKEDSYVAALEDDLVIIKEDKPFTKEQKENEPKANLDEPVNYSFVGQNTNSNTIHKDLNVLSMSPTVFTNQGTSIEKTLSNANEFYFKVERLLISDFQFAKMNNLKLKINNEEVVLTAMNMNELNREDFGSRTSVGTANNKGRIISVVTNRSGVPFRFNQDGKYDPSGQVAYQLLPDPSKYIGSNPAPFSSTHINSINHIAKLQGKSYKEAEKIYRAELLLLDKIRKEVLKRKDNDANTSNKNPIQFEINGGTLGFSKGKSTNKTKVSDINMDNTKTKIILTNTEDKVKGFDINRLYLINIDGYHGQPLRLTTSSIDSSILYDDVNLADYLTDLMTLDFDGLNKYDLKKKVDQYMFFGDAGFTMSVTRDSNGNENYDLYFKGKLIDLNSEGARDLVRSKFSEINTYQQITSIKGRNVISPKDVYTEEDIDSLVRVESNGGVKYYSLSKMKFKTSSASKSQVLNTFKIEKIKKENGVNTLEKSSLSYYNFIKNNTTTKAELTIDNKLEKVGAYLTYEPTEKTLNSVGATKVDKQFEEIKKVVGEKEASKNVPTEEGSMYLFDENNDANSREYLHSEITPQLLKELGYSDIRANIIMNSICG